jgi:hypothetical protein
MKRALPNSYFEIHGLVSLLKMMQPVCKCLRTAGYGTERPVVGEDGGREASAYSIYE